MNLTMAGMFAAVLSIGFAAWSQTPAAAPATTQATPGGALADSLAQRFGNDLHVKTVVGEPVKAGSVTLIPILAVEVNFGGGAVQAPKPGPEGGAFFMSGSARPLGFVAVTPKGTRFISVAKAPAK